MTEPLKLSHPSNIDHRLWSKFQLVTEPLKLSHPSNIDHQLWSIFQLVTEPWKLSHPSNTDHREVYFSWWQNLESCHILATLITARYISAGDSIFTTVVPVTLITVRSISTRDMILKEDIKATLITERWISAECYFVVTAVTITKRRMFCRRVWRPF